MPSGLLFLAFLYLSKTLSTSDYAIVAAQWRDNAIISATVVLIQFVWNYLVLCLAVRMQARSIL